MTIDSPFGFGCSSEVRCNLNLVFAYISVDLLLCVYSHESSGKFEQSFAVREDLVGPLEYAITLIWFLRVFPLISSCAFTRTIPLENLSRASPSELLFSEVRVD